ncbi:hypothetical protein D3C86_1459640 [compost metagenome]
MQGREGLFTGVDHVAEVEQRMQARMLQALEQPGDLAALELLVLLEVEEQIVLLRQLGEVMQVAFDQVQHPREMPLVARVDADIAHAEGPGDGHDLIHLLLARAADFQVQVEAQAFGLGGKGQELLPVHPGEAVLLAVEQVQADALELMGVGEIEQVGGLEATLGEVAQQRIGMGEQTQLLQSFEQLFGHGWGE